MNANSILAQLKKGDKEVLSEIYITHRSEFTAWLNLKYKVEADLALEIYQQTIMVFYENILKGHLIEINSQIKTYLFAIGKNKLQEEYRFQNKTISLSNDKSETIIDDDDLKSKVKKEKDINGIRTSLMRLGEHCRELLKLFYYQDLSLDEIMAHFDYKNRNTAKNQKYKCMEQLRKIHKTENSESYGD